MAENENAAAAAPENTVDATPANEAPQEAAAEPQAAAAEPQAEAAHEEITYHAVEKDGQVTAIWEMQGRKHLRTIDPRSRQGQDILRLYTTEHHDEVAVDASAS